MKGEEKMSVDANVIEECMKQVMDIIANISKEYLDEPRIKSQEYNCIIHRDFSIECIDLSRMKSQSIEQPSYILVTMNIRGILKNSSKPVSYDLLIIISLKKNKTYTPLFRSWSLDKIPLIVEDFIKETKTGIDTLFYEIHNKLKDICRELNIHLLILPKFPTGIRVK